MQIESIQAANDQRFQALLEAEQKRQDEVDRKQQAVSQTRMENKFVKLQVEKQRHEFLKEEASRIRNQRNLAMQYKVATKYAIENQNKQRRDIVK